MRCHVCGKPITDEKEHVKLVYGGDELHFHLPCFRRWMWLYVFKYACRGKRRVEEWR